MRAPLQQLRNSHDSVRRPKFFPHPTSAFSTRKLCTMDRNRFDQGRKRISPNALIIPSSRALGRQRWRVRLVV
ncbi:MAG TPA: hypothetical protein VJ123_02665 [Anaerolineales bacterium]|nr:hypothetical protein [Anaerolineales bacterium]